MQVREGLSLAPSPGSASRNLRVRTDEEPGRSVSSNSDGGTDQAGGLGRRVVPPAETVPRDQPSGRGQPEPALRAGFQRPPLQAAGSKGLSPGLTGRERVKKNFLPQIRLHYNDARRGRFAHSRKGFCVRDMQVIGDSEAAGVAVFAGPWFWPGFRQK